MSTLLPDVPFGTAVTDDNGLAAPKWLEWFRKLYARVGGSEATTNSEGPQTGDIIATLRASSRTGWLLMNGDTLGDADSGADHTGTDYRALFEHLWDEVANTELAILDSAGAASTRGASARADWDAHKRMPIPDGSGLPLRGIGTATINARSKTGPSALAAYQEDQFQKHKHTTYLRNNTTDGEWIAISGGNGVQGSSITSGNHMSTGLETTSGSAGTPRTGTETQGAALGVNWLIKL